MIEFEHLRKKVYMSTMSSTFIEHRNQLTPQWVSDCHLNYLSAYEFSSYNIQEQSTTVISRQHGQNQVEAFEFRPELNELNCEVSYVYREKQKFLLTLISGCKVQQLLLYKNNIEKKVEMVFEYLNFFIQDEEQQRSNKSLAVRTQHLIDEINQEEQDTQQVIEEMGSISQIVMMLSNSYGLLVVEIKKRTGIMLVNVAKCQGEKEKDFECPLRPTSFRHQPLRTSSREREASRIIYIFPEKIESLHKTKDITQFLIQTERHILLTKVSYEQMELAILHRIEFNKHQLIISVGIIVSEEEEIALVLVEQTPNAGQASKADQTSKAGRSQKAVQQTRMFHIDNRSFVEIKESETTRSRETQMEGSLRKERRNQPKSVKFCDDANSVRMISEDSDQAEGEADFSGGIVKAVYNKISSEEQRSGKDLISQKELLQKENATQIFSSKLIGPSQSELFELNRPKNIAGFVCNENLVLFWEELTSVIHVCRIMSKREQEEAHRVSRDNDRSKQAMQLQKEAEIKQVCSQLMGVAYHHKKTPILKFQSKITYLTKIDLELPQQRIIKIILSPTNSNILIMSNPDNSETVDFNIFQLDLFKQLGNQDPGIFIKPIKNIYKPRPVENINTGLVKESSLILSGTVIHSLENQLFDGALSFDIHPYNFFIAVSFGFSAKIYAVEGTQQLTSLFSVNGQGIKQVKYSPLGNHLCVLTSKSIKVLDAYSFTTKVVLHQKLSNFTKCCFSSSGLEFYTMTDNHHFAVYNTFDFCKLDVLRPIKSPYELKYLSVKSYLKFNQYCFVLENGGLYVRFKNEAIVVSEEVMHVYDDGEKISCLEIDEKNGILFTGCRSGKVRGHIWPIKDNDTFENYSQLRSCFNSVSCLALSNLTPLLYIGCSNGNVSKVKYGIDRDKGIGLNKEHNLLLTDRNFRYLSIGTNNIEKMYRFVLSNSTSTITEELPDRMRLEFKLSEVIQKLNFQMNKLKTNIRSELEEKSKLTMSKVDFGLLHHINHMISTKLFIQLKEEIEANKKETKLGREEHELEFKEVMEAQNQLIKDKSYKIYDYSIIREQLKKQLGEDENKYKQEKERELARIGHKNDYAETVMNSREEEVFFLPNQEIQEYELMKASLDRELSSENKRHYDLRKECAYKETAMQDMRSKKVKEEILEFKINMEKAEMQKKLNYSRDIVSELRLKIEASEQKVNLIQNQAYIIKNNAQYKKVAKVDEMIDDCSYSLWMKDKLEAEEILQCSNYLKSMADELELKGEEIIDLLADKKEFTRKIEEHRELIAQKREQFTISKLNLLNIRRKLVQLDISECFNEFRKGPQKQRRPRLSCELKSAVTDRKVRRTSSSRIIDKLNKELPFFSKVIEKETDCLKVNIRNHHRKVKKLGKENGRILLEYERLKFEKKHFREREISAVNSLEKIKNDDYVSHRSLERSGPRPTTQLSKTSFQRYVQLKSSKTSRNGLTSKTASGTPSHLVSPSLFESFDLKLD